MVIPPCSATRSSEAGSSRLETKAAGAGTKVPLKPSRFEPMPIISPSVSSELNVTEPAVDWTETPLVVLMLVTYGIRFVGPLRFVGPPRFVGVENLVVRVVLNPTGVFGMSPIFGAQR